jgi:hypothetical protein
MVVLMTNLFGWFNKAFHGWIDPCEKARKNKKKLAVIQLPGWTTTSRYICKIWLECWMEYLEPSSFLLGSSSLANHGGYLSCFIYNLPAR